MAACKLSIALDEPAKIYVGGEPISGQVLIKPDKDVNCKALVVTSRWCTHGRGNIAQGEAESKSLFQGSWLAGQEYRYPFKVATASWPPSYYGSYLNVSHYVDATADVPWSIDPKTTQEFRVAASETPEDLAPTDNKVKKTGWLGWLIGIVLVGILLIVIIPFAFFLVPIIAVGAGLYWFFAKFLPKQITGPVEYKLDPAIVSQGQMIRATCEFTPRRGTYINGITWTIRCAEECVSGSGSNRQTHKHEVLNKVHQLFDPGPLQAGQLHKYEVSFQIPATAPPSMKFSDNEIKWTSELRIDIPKWPDWSMNTPFIVKVEPANSAPAIGLSNGETVVPTDADDPWLTEVYQQVIQSADEDERLSAVLEAVNEQTFAITVDMQSEVDEPMESDIEDDLVWMTAVDTLRNVRLVCCVPETMDAQLMRWVSSWRGTATIIGLESDTGRVMLRLID